MPSSNLLIPVFIETDLGTCIAMPVSPDVSAKEFKRELERVHLYCFPRFGNIKVNGLMVKQKSRYYHLSESLPLKCAFQGSNSSWFLQSEVHMQSIDYQMDSFNCDGTEVINHNPSANFTTDSVELKGSLMYSYKNRMKCRRKKRKILTFLMKIPAVSYLTKRRKKRRKDKRNNKIGSPGRGHNQRPLIAKESFGQFATRAEFCWSKNWDSSVIAEALSEALPESVSVSGLIKKYFSDCDEVASSSIVPFAAVRNKHKERLNNWEDSKYLNVKPDPLSPVTVHTPLQASHNMWPENPSPEASREKCKKPEVGKRLLLASNSLGLTSSSEMPALSLCKFGDKRSTVHRSAAMIPTLVFEIQDEGD